MISGRTSVGVIIGSEARGKCLVHGHCEQRKLELGTDTGEEVEARARDLGAALGVNRAEELADLEMVAYGVRSRTLTNLAEHDVVVLAACRDAVLDDVVDRAEQLLQLGGGCVGSDLRVLHRSR